MSRNYALKADKRDRAGKGIARALRRENKTPAVIYGDHKDPITIAIDTKEANLEYRRGHMFTSLCDMQIGGEKHLVLARDVQLHPVTDNVLHIDFLRVTPKTKIVIKIPVHFINHEESPGLRDKGILNVSHYELEMMCVATDIPDHIDVDLTGKEMGDSITIADAKLPKGAEMVGHDDNIGSIMAPKTAAQEEAEDAAAAAASEASLAEAKAGDAAAAEKAEGEAKKD